MTSEEMERAIEFLLDHHAKVSADIAQLTVEMREGFNNLIIANEVTRNLAEDVARLTIQNSQRITKLEEKAS